MIVVYYKEIRTMIDISELVKMVIDIILRHHDTLKSINNDRGLLFTLKFWSLLCYFLDIKRRLSIVFHLQTDEQIKRKNSTMEVYFWAFVNWEQNDWANFLLIVEFTYNNTKNMNIDHTPFELNSGYHPRVFF